MKKTLVASMLALVAFTMLTACGEQAPTPLSMEEKVSIKKMKDTAYSMNSGLTLIVFAASSVSGDTKIKNDILVKEMIGDYTDFNNCMDKATTLNKAETCMSIYRKGYNEKGAQLTLNK